MLLPDGEAGTALGVVSRVGLEPTFPSVNPDPNALDDREIKAGLSRLSESILYRAQMAPRLVRCVVPYRRGVAMREMGVSLRTCASTFSAAGRAGPSPGFALM